MVNGLTSKKSAVLIYINGSYSGLANISNNDPDLNNFSYLSPVIKDFPDHKYTVTAIARDLESLTLSSPTESKVISVIEQSYIKKTDTPKQETIIKQNTATNSNPNNKQEEKLKAPTIITPKGNINESRPLISGFSKNQTKVKIYIDGRLEAMVSVKDKESGTGSFEYRPDKDLDRGLHFISSSAINDKGLESDNSNILYFFISKPQTIATSTITSPDDTQPQITIELNNSNGTTTSSTIDLKKSKIAGSAFNISLLILFAIGVIIWIITTNMELKNGHKEKGEIKK